MIGRSSSHERFTSFSSLQIGYPGIIVFLHRVGMVSQQHGNVIYAHPLLQKFDGEGISKHVRLSGRMRLPSRSRRYEAQVPPASIGGATFSREVLAALFLLPLPDQKK